jgi:hypothetical protein
MDNNMTNNNEILEEGLLTSEFTFGFELEGIIEADSDLYYDVAHYESRYDDEENDYYNDEDDEIDIDETYSSIRYEFDNVFYSNIPDEKESEVRGYSNTESDGSLNGDGYRDICFEYSSKIFPCTPFWFNKVIRGLETLLKRGLYTNDSCGFHHHFRFGHLDERNVVWIYCNMASDPEFAKQFGELEDEIELFDRHYASYSSIRNLGDAIKNDDYEDVLKYLTTEKYRAFRIHPQGTLEWRGPRGFLNLNSVDLIKRFYILFSKMIGKVREYMSSNVIVGTTITKEEFFNNLVAVAPKNTNMEFLRHTEWYDSGTRMKFKTRKRDEVLLIKSLQKSINAIKSKPIKFVKAVKSNERFIELLFSIATSNAGQDFSILLKDLTNIIYHCVDEFDELYSGIFPNVDDFVSKLYTLIKKVMSPNNLTEFIMDKCSVFINCIPPEEIKHLFLNSVSNYNTLNRLMSRKAVRNLHISLTDMEKVLYKIIFSSTRIEELPYFISFLRNSSYLFNDNVCKKLLFWVMKAYYVKNAPGSAIYISEDDMMYIKEIVGNDIKKWNDCMIQFSETHAYYYRFIIGELPLRTNVRLLAINDDIKNFLSQSEIREIQNTNNINLGL